MSKHTPGPWSHNGEIVFAGKFTYDAVKGHESWVNHVNIAVIDDGENWLANAKLIAAAPELLEALKFVVGELDILHDAGALNENRIHVETKLSYGWADVLDELENTIAKAEGKEDKT